MPKNVKKKKKRVDLPKYHGLKWIDAHLPKKGQIWSLGKKNSVGREQVDHVPFSEELAKILRQYPMKWPKRSLYFICDLHADADAFSACLVATGAVRKTGPGDKDFKLTRAGKRGQFLIGGDCFDKGPSTLRLLRSIRRLSKIADVRILAGNHDVRMMLGIRSVGMERDPRTEHFFIRMGPKVIPFLREINDEYLQGKNALRGVPSNKVCRKKLYPTKRWFDEFPHLASWVMPDNRIEREVKRLREKMECFEADCAKAGLSLRMVYAAAKRWQQLFMQPGGEFYWFFNEMQLAYRTGSFLFIHAGLDDRTARIISDRGVRQLNRRFLEQLHDDLFYFYYGPIANTVRTKYRDQDMPLTKSGVKLIHQKGIHSIVHGHRNLCNGQRIMLRKGIINFECDASVDRATRKQEGLSGQGGAATIFHPDKVILGVSSDYPHIKVFDPRLHVRKRS